MMDEEIRQALTEVQEMKKMCGNINMKLTNIVTQRGRDWKAKLEAEYQRGLSEGNDIGYKDGVKDGQNEAWEAARKIIHMPEGELLNIFTECYSAVCTALQVILKYDASEAIEKLKAYEEKKSDDEIKVGDEVISLRKNGEVIEDISPWIVTYETKYTYQGFDACGMFHSNPKEKVRKIGRHFNIASILKEMQS